MEDMKAEEEALRVYTAKTKAELEPKHKKLMVSSLLIPTLSIKRNLSLLQSDAH